MTVAVSFVFRLFQTRFAWDVSCSEGRLYEVELELLLGRALGAMCCVVAWDEDGNDPCFRCWDGSCRGGNCGWSDTCSSQHPVCVQILLVGEMVGPASRVKHSGTKSEATLLAFSSTECTALR